MHCYFPVTLYAFDLFRENIQKLFIFTSSSLSYNIRSNYVYTRNLKLCFPKINAYFRQFCISCKLIKSLKIVNKMYNKKIKKNKTKTQTNKLKYYKIST